ncbi:MAG: twin-arginine translocation signal domain-containing protein, partial [Bdellovibrionales bacterium]|nr:twin-arginine translocation signal domain-containing protein [Bdellovibrionales bacterium]
MKVDRRKFLQISSATAAVAAVAPGTTLVSNLAHAKGKMKSVAQGEWISTVC